MINAYIYNTHIYMYIYILIYMHKKKTDIISTIKTVHII